MIGHLDAKLIILTLETEQCTFCEPHNSPKSQSHFCLGVIHILKTAVKPVLSGHCWGIAKGFFFCSVRLI